jgi:hypothetical protein
VSQTRSHSKASHAASRHPPDAPSLPAATRERPALRWAIWRPGRGRERLHRP